jgi:hypothetical protein
MVVLAVVVGALSWRLLSSRALDDRTDAAVAELRRLWRGVDVRALADDYSAAVTAANDTGDYRAAFALFPKTEESTLSDAGFGRGWSFDGAYEVDTWGRHRCIPLRVTGPTPNRLVVRVRDGEC